MSEARSNVGTAPRLSIVVPLFNEAENLPVLAEEMRLALAGH